MIRLEPAQPPLSTAEQLAADTILDVSRLLRTAEITDLDVVRLRLLDRPVATDVKSLRAANWHFEVGDGEVRAPRQLMTIVATWLGGAEQRANRLDRYGRVLPDVRFGHA